MMMKDHARRYSISIRTVALLVRPFLLARYYRTLFPDVATQPHRFGLPLEKTFVGIRRDRLL